MFVKTASMKYTFGNGQPSEPALCQLYRHTFVPYGASALSRKSRISATLMTDAGLRPLGADAAGSARELPVPVLSPPPEVTQFVTSSPSPAALFASSWWRHFMRRF